ncbi:MAG: hypothetical protein H6595_03920 [Flavobacteriales bacterium]|nr:hypothetical protein [Flavobacteriales bacterium]MCB9166606.1 hypothetical protein [Flavobacteriales bacterium]
MRIKEASDPKLVRDWMRLPGSIYANDANWIPHLKQDVEKVFDPKRNKLFKEGAAKRWILEDANGRPIGRIAAFINPKTSATEKQPTGGVGFFECIDDQRAADLLFDTAREWLSSRGMMAMDGPINFGEKNMFWGLLIENFTDPPIYGVNYNPPYYQRLFETYGFLEYYKQLFFKRSMSVRAQPIFWRKFNQLTNDPDFRIRDAKGKRITELAEDFRTVYNAAWVDHDNFKPMEQASALKIIKAMKPVMDPRILIWVDHKDKPVAFYISLPELNEIFRYVNGDLNWLGKLKFLWHKWRGTVKTMTGIVFGVAKEFQGKGLEGAMIVHAEQTIVDTGIYRDTVLTWIGDFNPRMIKVCQNLDAVNYRTMATYRYLFDRNAPFERHPVIDKK